jgi:hypothetical protein
VDLIWVARVFGVARLGERRLLVGTSSRSPSTTMFARTLTDAIPRSFTITKCLSRLLSFSIHVIVVRKECDISVCHLYKSALGVVEL